MDVCYGDCWSRRYKTFWNIPVTVTNIEELEEDDLVVYPKSDLVTDIYITGKLSDLQKINEDDIHKWFYK